MGEFIEQQGLSEADAFQLLVWFSLQNDNDAVRCREKVWSDLLSKAGTKKASDRYGDPDSWSMCVNMGEDRFIPVVHEVLAELAGKNPFEGYRRDLTPAAIEQLATLLGLSFEADWKPTEEFLELLSIEELWNLDNKWVMRLKERDHPTKAKLIAGLVGSGAKKPLPDFVRKLKAFAL